MDDVLLYEEKCESPSFDILECEQSAMHGFATAQYNLGKYYENGRHVDLNLDEAASWYKKAAEQHEINAKSALECLENYDVPQYNLLKCIWAAKHGCASAMFNLGSYYEKYGGKRSQDEALMWYKKTIEKCHNALSFKELVLLHKALTKWSNIVAEKINAIKGQEEDEIFMLAQENAALRERNTKFKMGVDRLTMRRTGAIDKTSMFDFIKYAKDKADFSVAAICKAVGVSEAGYYKWLRKEQQ